MGLTVGQNISNTQPFYLDQGYSSEQSPDESLQPYGGSVDPKMLAAARALPEDKLTLQGSPSAEERETQDSSEKKPKSMPLAETAAYGVLGAAAGIGAGRVIETADAPDGFFNKALQKIYGLPGVSRFSDALNSKAELNNSKVPAWLKELSLSTAVVPKGASPEVQQKAINDAIRVMERNQLKDLMPGFQKTLSQPQLQQGMSKLSGIDLLDKAAWEKHSFDALNTDLNAKIEQLGKATNPAEKKLKSHLIGLRASLAGSHADTSRHLIRQTAKLSSEGVGPVGRFFRSFGTYFNRMINADSLTGAPIGSGSALNKGVKMLGPGLMGAFTLVPAIQGAKEAKEGEKTSAFFRNFIGFGVANALGFEFGKRVIRASGMPNKLLGRYAHKVVVPFFRITAGRFAAGLGAMFLIAPVFQKAGEKLSDSIFGKPGTAVADKQNDVTAQQA